MKSDHQSPKECKKTENENKEIRQMPDRNHFIELFEHAPSRLWNARWMAGILTSMKNFAGSPVIGGRSYLRSTSMT